MKARKLEFLQFTVTVLERKVRFYHLASFFEKESTELKGRANPE